MKLNYSILVMFILVFISCKDKQAQKNEIPADTATSNINIPAGEIQAISFSEPSQQITVVSDKITEITGKKGIRITIDPSVIQTEDGSPLGKTIIIDLKEMINQEDLFKNDASTVSDGRLLVSGGAYHIAMTSDGKNLKIKDNKKLSIKVPSRSEKNMELFYGERDDLGNLNWKATGEKLASFKTEIKNTTISLPPGRSAGGFRDTAGKKPGKSDMEQLFALADKRNNRIPVAEFKILLDTLSSGGDFSNYVPTDIDNAENSQRVTVQTDSVTGKTVTKVENTSYYPAGISKLGWVNIDRFYNNPKRSTLDCEFDSSLKVQDAVLYVIYKNINSVQKERLTGISNGLNRLNSSLPAGERIKLIVITNIKGQFYSYMQDIILKENEVVKVNFKPSSDLEKIKSSYSF